MKTENIEDIYELTPLQKGILFHSLYANELGLYFFQQTFILHGNLNIDAFEKAWQIVVDRHTILRTGFYWEEIDNPLQVVYKQVKIPLKLYDWSTIEPVAQQQHLESFLVSDRKQGFDFSQPCLMRLILIRFNDDCYQFILSHHMLNIDGWTLPIIFHECVQIYTALCQDKEVSLASTRPFRDYIDWLQQQDIFKAEIFWRQALKGVKAPTSLTYIETRQLYNQVERYDEETLKLSATTTKTLQSLAKQHRLTLATLVHAAWAILLSRYTCSNNIVYGCTVTGRPVDLAGSESMVGVFINTLPICVKLDPQQLLLSWLQNFQTQLVEARHYEYTSLTQIQEWSEVPRNFPLFKSIVVDENLPISKHLQEWKGNIEFQSTGSYYKTNYPLTIVIYPDTELIIAISYDSNSFDIATITGILKDFEIVLQSMVNNPTVQLKDLSLLTHEQQQITSILEQEALFKWDVA
ncbi:MAG: condensation domain-containing protein [Nostoc sp.]|uniref:condensation domain-containing protein n=1 Tax=Nostoc sp. TaxID=1180 RepID=UPI002FEEE72B